MQVGALVRAYLARSACRAGAAVARRDIVGVSADFSAGAAIEAPLNARSGGLLGPSVVASRTVASPLALDHDELHPPAARAREDVRTDAAPAELAHSPSAGGARRQAAS